MDVPTTMILTSGPVMDFLLANLNVKEPRYIDWAKAKKMPKNLMVMTRHSNMQCKIAGLSEKCYQQLYSVGNLSFRPLKLAFHDLAITCAVPKVPQLKPPGLVHCFNAPEPKPEPDDGGFCKLGDWKNVHLATEVRDRVVPLTCQFSSEGGMCRVYLVGTTHYTPESRSRVKAVISSIEPEIAFLELSNETAWAMKDPKSEFFVAREEVEEYGGKIVLGDQPFKITKQRLQMVSAKEQARWFYDNGVFDVTIEDNNLKQMGLAREYLNNKCPAMMKIIIHERDEYMTAKLKELARECKSLVAVVGKSHVIGIMERLGGFSG